jgi:hypothetical protein
VHFAFPQLICGNALSIRCKYPSEFVSHLQSGYYFLLALQLPFHMASTRFGLHGTELVMHQA